MCEEEDSELEKNWEHLEMMRRGWQNDAPFKGPCSDSWNLKYVMAEGTLQL